MSKKLWLSILGSAAAAGAYLKFLRPRLLNWGAMENEIYRRMLGDELVDGPTHISTKAITVNARPDDIWPWLVQLGEHRGGFYSYDFLDRLLDMKLHSAHRILPRYQDLESGDVLDSRGMMVVRRVEPEQALVIEMGNNVENFNSTWAIILERIDDHRTRLLSRVRARVELDNVQSLLWLALLDPGQFIMEQKFMREIKIHAEGRGEKWPPEPSVTLH